MKSFLLKIINLGTTEIGNKLEKAQTQIFNLSCLLGILFPTIATISLYLSVQGIPKLVHLIFCTSTDALFIILLSLNAKGKHTFSSILVPIICLIVVSFAFLVHGGSTQHELIFLAISISPFLFPSSKEWFRFLFMGLFMAAFLICSYISFPPFTITTPEMIRTVNSHIYWIVTGLLFYQILAIYYLYKIVIKDLVEKKQEIFKAKEKAEENDRLKSAFLANISHEIRTPMNVVMGFSDQLLEKEVSREDRIEYAEIINSSSQRLLDIVNDILDLSKIETNQIEVENKAVNLSQLLEELHYLFRQMADEKKLQFVLDDDLGKGDFYCITDEVKIRQILINFLSNAIKYSESGQIQLKCRLLGEHIEFCVKDTGIGIPREFQQVIFDRFRQIETHMSKGTGLGLAISKGLAELLNGKVCVNSVEGKGSSFFLNIPYISIQESLIVNGNSASNKLAINFHHFDKKRILIAEDELLNFKLLEVIFKDLNVEIVWVQNGVEAVKKVDEESFDIVLMDVKMPVMDGLEASRKIRITHPHLYIVAQSAFAYKEDQELAIEAGCDYYLTKPIDKDKLLSVIYNPVYLRENIQMDK